MSKRWQSLKLCGFNGHYTLPSTIIIIVLRSLNIFQWATSVVGFCVIAFKGSLLDNLFCFWRERSTKNRKKGEMTMFVLVSLLLPSSACNHSSIWFCLSLELGLFKMCNFFLQQITNSINYIILDTKK